MKFFIRSVKLLCALVIIGNITFSQLTRTTTKIGTTAAQFLKINPGAKNVALGGTGTALDGDVYAIFWNPGSLSRLKSEGETSFNHVEWIADINYDFAATAFTIQDLGTIGLSLVSFKVPEDIVRTEINPDGDGRRWSAGSIAVGLSFARSLTDRFSIGFTAKYINEAIWNMSSSGFAFDIGTIYTTQFNGLKIGAAISNFGTKLKLDGHDNSFNAYPSGDQGRGPQNIESQYKTDAFDIPLLFRIGASMDAYKDEMLRVTASVDATHPNDNVEYVNSGVEIGYEEMFFARVGYKSLFMNNSEESLTWGAGVNLAITNTANIKVDYAFADFGRLKNVNYISISISY